jgi:hypothetical protein
MIYSFLVLSVAVSLVVAGPAQAQSTVILPQPDGGYLVVPPAGPASQILPMPGGGALVVTPDRPAMMILPLPGSAAETVPFSAAEPCCEGLPSLPAR